MAAPPSHRAVELVEALLRAGGVLAAVGGVLVAVGAFLASLSGSSSAFTKFAAVVVPVVVGAVWALGFFFLAGLLQLLVAIERNTRR